MVSHISGRIKKNVENQFIRNNMTKQEKIKEEWGSSINSYIKSNNSGLRNDGWSCVPPVDELSKYDVESEACHDLGVYDSVRRRYRPKSLQGIENNNGWNSMDQPDFEDNEYILFLRFIEGEGEPPIFTCVLCDDFEIGYFTHWKRVDCKKPPIY